ncbi:MAG TPA: alpha/beta hydrolase [Xanthobacteraceae bacterium]|nr:alpha/beta hydrolase [Xanthobacteraceae bacterium]
MDLNLTINNLRIEAAWHGPRAADAPTLVLLHEGLGCVALWKDFPAQLAERTRCGVFLYSRPGCGASDPPPLPRAIDFMHAEAALLTAVLDAAGINKCILVGHSDGGSIAVIHAGSRPDFRVRALCLLAPHFFVEPMTVAAIAQTKRDYEQGDLRRRLARYHKHVDAAFYGWAEPWLAFRGWSIEAELAHVRVPILILQGADDRYGSAAQIARARAVAGCPVEATLFERCAHSPHLDRPEATLDAVAAFVARVLAHEHLATAQ